jgi:hypothetical protein
MQKHAKITSLQMNKVVFSMAKKERQTEKNCKMVNKKLRIASIAKIGELKHFKVSLIIWNNNYF